MDIDSLPPRFPVLEDLKPDDDTRPPFMVSISRGFLPRQDPIVLLPKEFDTLESILSRMPIETASGATGLLAQFTLGSVVLKELPDLTAAIERYSNNLPLMNALYRDYSFLASAYLLEPCHQRFVKGEPYGLGRQTLPQNIALPIVKVASTIGFKPFMEYAGSYALFNYRLEDPALGLEYSNLRLIRAFERGLDATSSEAGFVLVHVNMVKHSGKLVQGTMEALDACKADSREDFNAGLRKVVNSMKSVNKVMNTMWSHSKPGSYINFRTFIFGIANQSMFPNGVVYEGVSEEPMSFRGESGANDSMIPLLDSLLQIDMPSTPLTAILKDFRSYRPGNHRDFLHWVHQTSTALRLKDYAMQSSDSSALYVLALNEVRDFRWRHWCFTREYILKNTTHPTATGGSPIVTWLPNQLQAVLSHLVTAAVHCQAVPGIADVLNTARCQEETLQKEVAKYCADRGVAA